ncbi:MAG TPA: filamentous hemagglutinin N-terminal domain-containing protein [Nitrospirales bacterium]|nr:filamentous hemagglutinin N-terminal domain-containing protein [Nitrospirales bacterium]
MPYPNPPFSTRNLCRPCLIAVILAIPFPVPCFAQVTTAIVPDSTLPVNSSVHQIDRNFHITAGTSVGANLFHSFDTFHVGTGDTANFVNPGGMANILSRITGDTVSNIFGTLQSESTANLFFMNPNGVVFGPDATLNVNGSFHVSTADFLSLGEDPDSGHFPASDQNQGTLLSVAPPEAFGFLEGHNGLIAIQGSRLGVPAGETLSVIGGPIQIDGGSTGFLSAPEGQINLVAVGAPGEVPLNSTIWIPTFNQRLKNIELTDGAVLDTSGDKGGAIAIKAEQLTISDSFILGVTRGEGNGTGVDIFVSDSVLISNGIISSATISKGHAGAIHITAPTLTVDDAIIGTGSFGEGAAGPLTVNVDRLTVQQGGFLDTRSSPQGNGGFLTIQGLGGTQSYASEVTLTGSTGNFTGEPSALIANALGQGETAGHAEELPFLPNIYRSKTEDGSPVEPREMATPVISI